MASLLNLPEADRLLVTKELRAGEQVRWVAKPDPVRASLPAYLVWFFAIPWLAISSVFFFVSLFGIFAILGGGISPMKMEGSNEPMSLGMAIVFFIFSLPFMGIGLGMLGAPFWTWHKAKNMVYVITAERVFAITAGRTLKVEACRAHNMGKITKTVKTDGSGTLSIETGTHRDSDGDKVIDKFELVAIPGVNEAERYINELTTRR